MNEAETILHPALSRLEQEYDNEYNDRMRRDCGFQWVVWAEIERLGFTVQAPFPTLEAAKTEALKMTKWGTFRWDSASTRQVLPNGKTKCIEVYSRDAEDGWVNGPAIAFSY